jgi:hypothetical protein
VLIFVEYSVKFVDGFGRNVGNAAGKIRIFQTVLYVYITFGDLTLTTTKGAAVWALTTCRLVGMYRYFSAKYFLYIRLLSNVVTYLLKNVATHPKNSKVYVSVYILQGCFM